MTRFEWMRGGLAAALLAGAALAVPAQAQTAIPVPGPTVDAIKKCGTLACGVDTGIPGWLLSGSGVVIWVVRLASI